MLTNKFITNGDTVKMELGPEHTANKQSEFLLVAGTNWTNMHHVNESESPNKHEFPGPGQ